jgi:hypothetical protein
MRSTDSIHPDTLPPSRPWPEASVVLTIRETAFTPRRDGAATGPDPGGLAAAAARRAEAYRLCAARLDIAVDEVTVEIGAGEAHRGRERITGTVRLAGTASRRDLLRLESEVRRHAPLLDLLRPAGPDHSETRPETRKNPTDA